MRTCKDCSIELPARRWPAKRPQRCPEHAAQRALEVRREGSKRPHRIRSVQNSWQLLHYGITLEQKEAEIAEQGGLCAICLLKPATNTDHDHRTGKFRGVLCWDCNTALGKFGDDAATLRSALLYKLRSIEGLIPHGPPGL